MKKIVCCENKSKCLLLYREKYFKITSTESCKIFIIYLIAETEAKHATKTPQFVTITHATMKKMYNFME